MHECPVFTCTSRLIQVSHRKVNVKSFYKQLYATSLGQVALRYRRAEPITMELFLGKKYKLVSSDNFEEYLKFIEIGFLSRKVAQAATPVSRLERCADGSYTFSVTSPIKSSVVTFREGEEFEETRLDGVKVKTSMTIEGNKLIQIQVEDSERTTTHLREFTSDALVVTTTADGWGGKCVRTYKLIE